MNLKTASVVVALERFTKLEAARTVSVLFRYEIVILSEEKVKSKFLYNSFYLMTLCCYRHILCCQVSCKEPVARLSGVHQ